MKRMMNIILGRGSDTDAFRYIADKYYGFTVGKHTYRFKQLFHNGSHSKLKSIGSFCSIAPNLTIARGNHPLDFVSTHPFLYNKKHKFIKENKKIKESEQAVIIGNDVWIGVNCTILPNVTIGNGSVIGACSVVTKSVPPYAIVVGNPARIIRYRFNKDKIESLENIKWWSKSDMEIKSMLTTMYDEDIFIERNNGYN